MFREPNTSSCVLCGATQDLTGEHKIKASVLRRTFGKEKLAVSSPGTTKPPRFAQSTNSKALKFRARLCQPCNTASTQAPDRAFEALHDRVSQIYKRRGNLDGVSPEELLPAGIEGYDDTFRYFAKLLACHLAEMGAPVMSEICDFARGKTSFNPMNFGVELDPIYEQLAASAGAVQYAAHGGVMVTGEEGIHWPQAFYSTLTIGPIQYHFDARLNIIGQVSLLIGQPEFFWWCKERIANASYHAIPAAEFAGRVATA